MKPTDAKAFDERAVTTPMIRREASVRPTTYNEADRSVEVVMSTGAAVLRFDWWDGEYYDEILGMELDQVRLARMNEYAPLLDSHNHYELSAVLGSVIPGSVRLENNELIGRVSFAGTPDVEDIEAKVRDGHIKKVSIAYHVHVFEMRDPPEDGARREMWAIDWEPIEVSFCSLPADFGAGARGAAQGATAKRGEQPARGESPGPSQGGYTCTIRGLAAQPKESNMPPELTPTPAPAPASAPAIVPAVDPAAEPRTATNITATRIRDVCARSDVGQTFALELIGRNDTTPLSEADLTDAIATELEARRGKPTIDARVKGDEGDGAFCRAVETAVLLRANPGLKIDDAKAVEDATEFRGMSLMEMARVAVDRTGVSTRGMGRLELAGTALGLRGGQMTTSDFANALSAAVSKRVRDAYEAAPQTFTPIVSKGTLPDFKATNIIGLGDAPQLLLVKENAEFKYGAIADTGMTFALATYGRIIAITRQAIINDDKALFSRIPTMFGRKAADLESDLVWGILTSNPTMSDNVALFHASHGNLAGSGAAISVATLAAAEQAMMQQTSVEGGYLNIRPRYLIVGPAKKVEAEQFLTAVMAQQASNVNPYPGTLTLIVEPRITGNQWFLAADPAAFDTIELAHLDGQESLYIETQPGFDVDGVKTKARLDVGATPIDHRGLYKNAGN